jgi:tRNA-modifying protein YgfZ
MATPPANDAARTSALVVRETEREIVRVRGSERATWLNSVVTCDVLGVTAGRAAFGLLLSKVGKIQADFYLLAGPDELLLALAPGTSAAAVVELERMLVMEDAELDATGPELACLALHGPRAFELAGVAAELPGVVLGSLDRTGLGGAVLLVPPASLTEVEAALATRGAGLAGKEDWKVLRVERRIGVFGTDYGVQDNPHEAGLDRAAVSWSKGCYLGQEVVFMQDARGKLKRRVVELTLEGPVPELGAAVLTPGGEAVGEVTSAAFSVIAGGPVALARVRAPHHEPGARLTVGEKPASVRADPV